MRFTTRIKQMGMLALAAFFCVLTSTPGYAAPAPTPTPAPAETAAGPSVTATPIVPSAAIFVRNTVKALEGKVDALEAQVGSRATEKGYSIASRADALNAVSSMATDGANVGDAKISGAQLDKILSNNSSALALARNMSADYLLLCNVVSYGQNKKNFTGNGIETLIVTSKLRLSYTLQNVATGATVPGAGGVVEASQKTRVDQNQTEEVDVINDLMDEAAAKLVEKMPPPPQVPADVKTNALTIRVNIHGLNLFDIVRNDKGEYVVTDTPCPVRATNATVELDGVIIGTATGTFEDVPTGLHKIRISCKGSSNWNDYEGTIKVRKGMVLDVDMHLSDKGHAQWRELTSIVWGLKAGTKITDAQVKVLEGQAQMLRQSGYKFDVKINTTEGVKIQNQAERMSVFQ